jgi:protein gp37
VSVEDQAAADARIPVLLETPAAVRFLACEPLIGPVSLRPEEWIYRQQGSISWVIVGGESGPEARPMNIEWARSLVAQCRAAAVPVFVKRLGSKPVWPMADPPMKLKHSHGADPAEWPEDLQVREFPR